MKPFCLILVYSEVIYLQCYSLWYPSFGAVALCPTILIYASPMTNVEEEEEENSLKISLHISPPHAFFMRKNIIFQNLTPLQLRTHRTQLSLSLVRDDSRRIIDGTTIKISTKLAVFLIH